MASRQSYILFLLWSKWSWERWCNWSKIIKKTQELDSFHAAILPQGDTWSFLYFPLSRFLRLLLENKSSLISQVREYKCNPGSVRSWMLWTVWRQWIINAKVFKGDQVLKIFQGLYAKKKNKMNIWIFKNNCISRILSLSLS